MSTETLQHPRTEADDAYDPDAVPDEAFDQFAPATEESLGDEYDAATEAGSTGADKLKYQVGVEIGKDRDRAERRVAPMLGKGPVSRAMQSVGEALDAGTNPQRPEVKKERRLEVRSSNTQR